MRSSFVEINLSYFDNRNCAGIAEGRRIESTEFDLLCKLRDIAQGEAGEMVKMGYILTLFLLRYFCPDIPAFGDFSYHILNLLSFNHCKFDLEYYLINFIFLRDKLISVISFGIKLC